MVNSLEPVNIEKSFLELCERNGDSGEVSYEMNITNYPDTKEIYVFNDPGRTRRPVIIVEDGESALKEEHIEKLVQGELK